MALSTYDIEAEQGSDYATVITYTDDAGSAINLTGYTSRMQVRKFAGSPNHLITLTSSSGMVITGGAGTIALTISAAALSQVPAGEYAYDLEIENGSSVTKLLAGKFEVLAEVTR
jgi:hypothetical protein